MCHLVTKLIAVVLFHSKALSGPCPFTFPEKIVILGASRPFNALLLFPPHDQSTTLEVFLGCLSFGPFYKDNLALTLSYRPSKSSANFFS
uniref:Secreted protein n=1 Tax=Arundo donax TaxID=35708 RepID=A0A0A9FRG4_ARUDO